MKGTLHKTDNGWVLRYATPYEYKTPTIASIAIRPDDLDSEIVRWAENGSLENKEVEFEITDEFTHPELYRGVGWGDGIKYAKLIEYPELEGTNALCEDIINKREAQYISDDFQIGPDGAYEHDEENEEDWDVTLMDGLEDDDDILPPTEELIESHKRHIEMMKHVHEEEWERIYSKYKGVSDLNDFFDWIKDNYFPPAKKIK